MLTYRFAAAGPGCVEHQGPYFAAQMLNDGITWAAFIQQSVETFKFVGIPSPVRHHECACSGDNIFYHSTCGCETYISMRCGKMPKHCEHMPLRVGSGGLLIKASQVDDPPQYPQLRARGCGANSPMHALGYETLIAVTLDMLADVAVQTPSHRKRAAEIASAVRKVASYGSRVSIGPGSTAETSLRMRLVDMIYYVHDLAVRGNNDVANVSGLDGTGAAFRHDTIEGIVPSPNTPYSAAEEACGRLRGAGQLSGWLSPVRDIAAAEQPSAGSDTAAFSNFLAGAGSIKSSAMGIEGALTSVSKLVEASRTPGKICENGAVLLWVWMDQAVVAAVNATVGVEMAAGGQGSLVAGAATACAVALQLGGDASMSSAASIREQLVQQHSTWRNEDEDEDDVGNAHRSARLAALQCAIDCCDALSPCIAVLASLDVLRGTAGDAWCDQNDELWLATVTAVAVLAVLLMGGDNAYPDAQTAVAAVAGQLVPSPAEFATAARHPDAHPVAAASALVMARVRSGVSDTVSTISSDAYYSRRYKGKMARCEWAMIAIVNPCCNDDASEALGVAGGLQQLLVQFNATGRDDPIPDDFELSGEEITAAKAAAKRSQVVARIYWEAVGSPYLHDRVTLIMSLVASGRLCCRCFTNQTDGIVANNVCGCSTTDCKLQLCVDCRRTTVKSAVRTMCRSNFSGAPPTGGTGSVPASTLTSDNLQFDRCVRSISNGAGGTAHRSSSSSGGGGSSSGGSSSGSQMDQAGSAASDAGASPAASPPAPLQRKRPLPSPASLARSALGTKILGHLSDLVSGDPTKTDDAIGSMVRDGGSGPGLAAATMDQLAALTAACLHNASGRMQAGLLPHFAFASIAPGAATAAAAVQSSTLP